MGLELGFFWCGLRDKSDIFLGAHADLPGLERAARRQSETRRARAANGERGAGYNDGLADTANETWKEGRDRRPGDGRDERAGRLLYPHLASFRVFSSSSQIMWRFDNGSNMTKNRN